MDMAASMILPCMHCEEQETRDSVIIKCSSFQLTHRRCTGSNRRCMSLPIRPCSKSLRDPFLLSKLMLSSNCFVSNNECRIDIPRISGVKSIESPSLINEAEPCTETVAATSVQLGDQVEQPTRVPSVLNQFMTVFLHLPIMAKALIKWTCRWVVWKWLFKVLNFVFEAIQLIFAVKNGQGKLCNHKYLWLTFIASVICLVIAIIDFCGEAKSKGATWQIKGWWCWFYYPRPEERVFGNFCLYFSVGSSIIQVVLNSVTLCYKKKILNVEYFPIIFALVQLVEAGLSHGVESPRCERETSSLIGSEIQSNQLSERQLENGGELTNPNHESKT